MKILILTFVLLFSSYACAWDLLETDRTGEIVAADGSTHHISWGLRVDPGFGWALTLAALEGTNWRGLYAHDVTNGRGELIDDQFIRVTVENFARLANNILVNEFGIPNEPSGTRADEVRSQIHLLLFLNGESRFEVMP